MARTESDHMFRDFSGEDLEQKLLLQILKILDEKYQNARSVPKQIGKIAGVAPDTVRKWRSGCNSLCLGHFLLLAKVYPEVLQAMLDLVGHESVSVTPNQTVFDEPEAPKSTPLGKIYSAKYCTINFNLSLDIARRLNQRQLWFLGLLQQNQRINADDIAIVWDVSARMAKYDVETLLEQGLIRFRGAKKNGWYEVTTLSAI
jgi:hypothetical protein